VLEHFESDIEGTILRWTRIALVITFEQANIPRPGVALGIRKLGFESYESGISLTWEDDRIVSLHAPVVGEIENVIWGANDHSAKVLILHQGADTVEFCMVNRPGHSFIKRSFSLLSF